MPVGLRLRPEPTGIIAPLNCARNCIDRTTQIIRIKILRIRLPERAYLENKIKVAVIHRKNVIANQPHNSSADTPLFPPRATSLSGIERVRVIACANQFFYAAKECCAIGTRRE